MAAKQSSEEVNKLLEPLNLICIEYTKAEKCSTIKCLVCNEIFYDRISHLTGKYDDRFTRKCKCNPKYKNNFVLLDHLNNKTKLGPFLIKESLCKTRNSRWLIECECGKELRLKTSKILDKGGNLVKLSCGCKKHKKGENHYKWKGYEEMTGSYLSSINKGKNHEFNVTPEYLWDLFLKQERRCALSGQNLTFGNQNLKIKERDRSASLDRIDSSQGYIEGNLQWVHKDINLMKSNWSDIEYINICRMVSNFQNEKEKVE